MLVYAKMSKYQKVIKLSSLLKYFLSFGKMP